MKNLSKKWTLGTVLFVLALCLATNVTAKKKKLPKNRSFEKIIVDQSFPAIIDENTFGYRLNPGDTIYISSDRTRGIKFKNIKGHKRASIVVVNYGGQVNINDQKSWGALTFENCSYIKVSGTGASEYKYGFRLAAQQSGLAFSELSTNCEAEFVMVDHEGFFGIYAKKDYSGNPPHPIPVFDNLKIHDCFIQNVSEGMYLGETKTPGMKFRGVEIYNNIVLNTGREAIQIANMVQDVEIYNNTLINAGLDNESSQSNILQIGDNTVSRIYNNIISDASAFGIISLGMGNNHIENNYIASSRGIFIDNRSITNPDYTISVVGNYFKNIHGYEVVKNMNELNMVTVTDNFWDADLPFFTNASGNEDNIVVENNVQMPIAEIEFTDISNFDYSLIANTPVEFIGMGAPGGPIYFGADNPENPPAVPEQIILTPQMVVDEVSGGSLQSPDLLVDEQTLSTDEHPLSDNWKPAYNMNNGPYSFYIDLQATYHLTQIALHDMHDVRNLEISVGEPGNWQSLLTDPCDKYNTWKQHFINVDTRYVRFTMTESVNAAINEVFLYGYGISPDDEGTLKSASLNALKTQENKNDLWMQQEFKLFPNPAEDYLNLTIPAEMGAADYFIEICDLNGRIVFSERYSQNEGYENTMRINIQPFQMQKGYYVLRFSNNTGFVKSLPFVKK